MAPEYGKSGHLFTFTDPRLSGHQETLNIRANLCRTEIGKFKPILLEIVRIIFF